MEMAEEKSRIQDVIRKHEKEILDEWVSLQMSGGTHRSDLVTEKEVRQDSQTFLSTFIDAVQSGLTGQGKQWDEVRNVLAQLSRTRALKGFSPSETATFVFSLKQPLFSRLASDLSSDPKAFAEESWKITTLLDDLGLKTTEQYLKTREEVIRRQQQDMMELSTPVVSLWQGIVALPIIGTLDSNRT